MTSSIHTHIHIYTYWTIHVMTSFISIGSVPVMDSGIMNEWMKTLHLFVHHMCKAEIQHGFPNWSLQAIFRQNAETKRNSRIVDVLIMKTNLCILYF